ncbi:MAG: hypothetical protein IJO65_02350 [Lachnospiraceae bacterium]|nr:hypothetical protein [Lachnospiraceae bacterium]
MKSWKKICGRLLVLPLWLVVLLTVISTVLLVTVFAKGWDTTPIAYVIYVLSFYTLMTICIACYKTIPGYYKSIKGKVYGNKYANRYLTDAVFKTHVTLYRSLTINLIYIVINAVSGIVFSTYWFGIFAIYYAIMAIVRFLLARYVTKNHIGTSRMGELKRARLCAYILMTVNLALSGAVLMMIYYNRGFEYQGILIYVMALYTFYITTTAVIDMIKYRKFKSPIMSVTKVIKMAAALFSMLFLETAMFSQFGGDTSPESQRIMIMATGAGISVIVVTMAVYMIVCTTKEIREYKELKKE